MIDEQQTNQKLLELKQRTLTIMYSRLSDEKAQLETEKQAKNNLLEQTKGEETVYQQLLEKTKAEEADVLTQIDTLRKNMAFVQEKMKTLGDKFNPEDYASLLNIYNSKDLKNYLEGSNDSNAEFTPGWPVNPLRGISAYFHDSAYAGFFHMQHQAVDIPTPQGTPIHAPADGFVYKTADNGYGYSYIMIAHANGFMTLYGHVSSILVNVGDEVKAGDIIGLSGATPGTKGAGVYTTGPHLHFEVIKNGVHVDPLDYLNLAYLRLDSLPEKYVSKALGDQKKVRRLPAKVRVKPVSADDQSPTEILNSGVADPSAAVNDSYGEMSGLLTY
jgi:murein DD-endopeptidase MepM/ murein hydrolase activator NlpD